MISTKLKSSKTRLTSAKYAAINSNDKMNDRNCSSKQNLFTKNDSKAKRFIDTKWADCALIKWAKNQMAQNFSSKNANELTARRSASASERRRRRSPNESINKTQKCAAPRRRPPFVRLARPYGVKKARAPARCKIEKKELFTSDGEQKKKFFIV